MKIVVCVKEVPDSAARIRVVADTGIDGSIIHMMNPYDEVALAAAVRIRESLGRAEIIILSLGPERARKTLESALARGADRGIFIRTGQDPGPARTGSVLAAAISDEGGVDLVLTGRESIDKRGIQVHHRLGRGLGWPVLNDVSGLEVEENGFTCRVEAGPGREKVYFIPRPAVIGAARNLALPRYPLMKDMMAARGKPVRITDPDRPALGDGLPDLEPERLEEHAFERQGVIYRDSSDRFIDDLILLISGGGEGDSR